MPLEKLADALWIDWAEIAMVSPISRTESFITLKSGVQVVVSETVETIITNHGDGDNEVQD